MKPFLGMWRDTWFLWIGLLGVGVGLGFLKSVFFLTIPITLFTFVYFSVVRYDADGNHKTIDD